MLRRLDRHILECELDARRGSDALSFETQCAIQLLEGGLGNRDGLEPDPSLA